MLTQRDIKIIEKIVDDRLDAKLEEKLEEKLEKFYLRIKNDIAQYKTDIIAVLNPLREDHEVVAYQVKGVREDVDVVHLRVQHLEKNAGFSQGMLPSAT